MSQVYVLEPPTKGKVVLRTTLGDLDIELWPKEAPKACRNFVQLCTEGYYDGTIFHRMIKDFMVQGGDPTGTGDGGQSIYGRPFKDEFHTRLKFNHRGVVACANQNRPDTNGSQFFVTLDRADHCNRQYTIFGKITGDTIYNLSRYNELEVGEDDRPAHPPVLTRADVLWNPFDDLQPRVDRDAKEAADAAAREAAAADAKKQTRKQAKNFALMSFGEEAEEEEADAVEAAAKLKIRSAHDALEDERLAKEPAVEVDLDKIREKMRAAKVAQQAAAAAAAGGDGGGEGDGDQDFDSRMRSKMQARRRAMGIDAPDGGGERPQGGAAEQRQRQDEEAELDYGEGSEGEGGSDGGSDDDKEGPRKRLRLADQGRGRKSSAAVVAPSKQIKVADSELLTDWERKRQEYKQRKRLGGSREKQTLARLAAFQQELKVSAQPGGADAAGKEPAAAAAAGGQEQQQQQGEKEGGGAAAGKAAAAAPKEGGAGYDGKVRGDVDHRAYLPAAWRVDGYLAGDEEELDLAALRQHKLTFAKGTKDAMSRSDNIDDYVVLDPLLEAGKAKFNKQQNRAKKRQSEWAGKGQG
ncbi:peptidyl-prolyl cis-trans isomerase CYP57-like [Micractinium conductrix]|uniref:Peptidyl-prolyl cis-trans isomerase CYP57-like n=1 Tax=Micractinium conductrix TaxID=554055 RepID=A0A2P6VSD8_9CHLO|nr:peptidyl-prolyl cis-trans isomerase CYP57-like [Micractinium conductrix]|eukprot:PSC77004.1 peptidyl-prolyl cis-trans isomerase CYP57-like [Micractinium conductrix]